jgi:hypothetical protein
MTEPEDSLDEGLRRRVGELYASDAPGRLDSAAQARVLLSAKREAERLVQVRRWRRLAVRVAAPLAAAAALLLALRTWGPMSRASLPLPAAATLAACKLPDRLSALAFETLPDARQRLVLDGFGVLWGAAGAKLRLQSAVACELLIVLDHGELAGDLHSLRPARLVIRTATADVVITGTRFAVRADDSLEVLLAKGTVDVLLPDARALHMRAGTRLHKTAGPSVQLAPLSGADGSRLDALLAAVTPPPSAAVTPAVEAPALAEPPRALVKKLPVSAARSSLQLLEAAESARRAGKSSEARRLYREAGGCNDDNAEVALLRWVRLELAEKDAAAATAVLARHGQAFSHGRLGAEAGWLQVQVFQAQQKPALAREAARQLLDAYAGTPQAEAARRLLRSPP